MELIVVFGLPGAGKTFVGKILEKNFGFYLYDDDGEKDMPQALKDAIVEGTATDSLRDEFFHNLIESVKKLTLQHSKIVVPQTFIKEKYREQFLKEFPETKFIFVKAAISTREERILKREQGFHLSLDNWRNMAKVFEEPKLEHVTITNNTNGEEDIIQQLQILKI